MKVYTLTVGPLDENCYLVVDEESPETIIIDPGAEAERIIEFIRDNALEPKMIINTHAHWDHIGAVVRLKEAFGIPFYMHGDDAEWLEAPLRDLFGKNTIEGLTVDRFVKHGDEFRLGLRSVRVVHTPGHTKGSCTVWFMNDDIAMTGDTLFKGSCGRVDFPGGSMEDMLYSLQVRMVALPDECVVYPGHGPKTTMAFERAHNPYMRYEA